MFTDIVTSTDLVGVIGDEAWNELLDWHDRELRSAVAEHGARWSTPPVTASSLRSNERPRPSTARSISSGASSATAASTGLRPRSGSGSTGPKRRVGVAITPAGASISRPGWGPPRERTRSSRRSAVLAGSSEARFTLSEPRMLTLKGVREPVEVRAVDWR